MSTGRIMREGGHALPLSIIGNVSIGEKNERGIPRSVDFFIPRGKYASFFQQAFGDKPGTIEIMFVSEDPAQSCNERYEYRTDDGRLYASGDGLEFSVWNQATKAYENFNILDHTDLMDRIHSKVKSKKGWQIIMTMRFIIPRISKVAGLWQFSTKGSRSTIPNVVGTFDTVKSMRGSVLGVLFDLNVEFAKSQKPGDASRFPVVTLVPNQTATEQVKNNILIQRADEQRQLEN